MYAVLVKGIYQTWGEHVVDKFQEAFLSNVGIREQEYYLLVFNAKLQVQSFQIFSEVGLTVSSAKCYLKHLTQSLFLLLQVVSESLNMFYFFFSVQNFSSFQFKQPNHFWWLAIPCP